MKSISNLVGVFALSALVLCFTGCNDDASSPSNVESSPPPETTGHDHPDHGPHGGDLIELGNESYHAELVHGDGDELSIYILDGAAKATVPIDATELVVNVSHDGTPEQFKLAAAPAEGDPAGKSSRFVANDAELSEHVHEEGAKAKLVVVIDGKQFTGEIAHDHDHDHGHAHDHEHK